MSKLNILGIDVENDNTQKSLTLDDLTVEQRIDLMLAGLESKEAVHDAWLEVEEACRAHHNATQLIEAHQRFCNDKGLEAICSSEEAWNMSDTLKKTLEKFKGYFKKVFEYVNNFVVLRITSSTTVIKKWADILQDSNNKKDRIESMKKEYDTRDCDIPTVKLVVESATTAFDELSKQAETVKGTSPTNKSSSDIEKLAKASEHELYKKFDEAWRAYEQMVPEGDNSGTTKAVNAETGKWFDGGSVNQLYSDLEKILISVKNMKRLQMTCNAIVTSLEKTSSDPDGTDKNINKQKIDWLNDFSKNVLSGMIGRIVKMTSRCASKCTTLTNMYSK